MPKQRTPDPEADDFAWAAKYGWHWRVFEGFGQGGFAHKTGGSDPFIVVIRNPMEHQAPGWTPWLQAIGALQMDAPFANVRAALRVAESIRQQRRLGHDEMSCNAPISPLELLALAAE